MITLVGIALLGLACVGFASHALDDSDPDRAAHDDSRALDALLFLLCLIGVLNAKRKRKRDEDSDE